MIRRHLKPSELVVMVGMPRAGSTTLYHHLRRHPDAAVPFRKETFYFSFYHDRGIDWFLDLYPDDGTDRRWFDVSPDYFYDERAIERILDFDPHVKAILSVREPISWALSLYNQRSGTQREMPPFDEFVHRYDLRVGSKVSRLEISEGLVTRMLERCCTAFGDNVLVYDFEFFRREPLKTLQAIEAFAGLGRHFTDDNFDNVRLNASDRRHNTRLYAILNNEGFISLLRRILPDRVLRVARETYYLAAAKKTVADPSTKHPEDNLRLAEEVFGNESKVVKQLFADHPIQLGSGEPFILPADAGR